MKTESFDDCFTLVPLSEADDVRRKFWIIDALNNLVIIKKRTRQAAQEVVNLHYGVGKYTVNAS